MEWHLQPSRRCLGLECVVYMGVVDIARQEPNVFRMKLLGAEVRPVTSGTQTLKDAINEAIRDWVTNVRDTHYLLGSALGPHPYPTIVREFQSVIGIEAREQMLRDVGRLPDTVIACVGGGSNAIGVFSGFVDDEQVELIGVEAGGSGIASGKHAARFGDATKARVGVIHGTRTYVLQDEDGQIAETHSVSAGLDYAAVGPEHAMMRDNERAFYTSATDAEALRCFPNFMPHRRDHPCAGVVSCGGGGHQACAEDEEGSGDFGQFFGARG